MIDRLPTDQIPRYGFQVLRFTDWHEALTGLSSAFQRDHMGKCLIEKVWLAPRTWGNDINVVRIRDSSGCLTILTRVRALVINSNPTEKSPSNRQDLVALFYGSLTLELASTGHSAQIYDLHEARVKAFPLLDERFLVWSSGNLKLC